MTFLRSQTGLSNQALFYDVDYVVYIEGRFRNLTKPPFDETYWGHVISLCRPDIRIRIKPLGAKSDLLPIAEGVRNGTADHILVCFDRDFDEFYSKLLIHQRILYTHGYSWENDICQKSSCVQIMENACSQIVKGGEPERNFDLCRNRLKAIGSRVGRYDVSLQAQGKPLQGKRKPGELVLINAEYVRFSPRKVRLKLQTLLNQGLNLNIIDVETFDFFTQYHGKTIAFCLYHSASLITEACGNLASFSYDNFIATLLKRFLTKNLSDSENVWNHHIKQCLAIT